MITAYILNSGNNFYQNYQLETIKALIEREAGKKATLHGITNELH